MAIALGCATTAAAQDAARPWADGVSEADQTAALELFRAGNELFAQSEYADAASKYREALGHWDHPAIHGNLAVSLIHLDDPLQAFAHVELALRWGAQPFEPHVYDQLVTSRKLLLGQLARIEVDCPVEGAEIALNGEVLFVGPGTSQRLARAGSHQVVASKDDYLTFTRQFDALPGEVTRVEVTLVPLVDAGGYERRWAEWKPWAVVGGGAALIAVGVGFQLSAQGNVDAYEEEIARSCPDGCVESDLPEAVRDLRGRARWENRVAVGAFTLGAGAVATGAILLYMNRPRRVRLDASGRRISATPLVAPGAFGVTLSFGY